MFGANIKRLRRKKNLTQMDLAKQLGVSRQAVCMWESDKRQLKAKVLSKIASIFDVPVDKIINSGASKRARKAVSFCGQSRSKRVVFSLKAVNAKEVFITGSFISWDNRGIPMKQDKDGVWHAAVDLLPGRYEYKFIVDGIWQADPANPVSAVNSFGTINSIKEIG